jgi:hypothetical protein
MARLKDRQRQIPGGFRFSLPEAGYESSPFSSFTQIANSVIKLTNANPNLAQKYGWPIDRAAVEDWVDDFNASICKMNGWREYYVDGGSDKHTSTIHRDHWPLWAKSVATMKHPDDNGVGDTVERTIGSDNSDALKDWYQKVFHRVCGCDGRKQTWNIKYPY